MKDEIQKDSGCKCVFHVIYLLICLGMRKAKRGLFFSFEGVELETLIKFNRLKVLTTDFGVIIDALKKSTSNLLEVSI